MTARKTTAKDAVTTMLDALFSDSETVSANALAEALDIKSKSLRAKLRSDKYRDQSVEKHNRWSITREQAETFARSRQSKTS